MEFVSPPDWRENSIVFFFYEGKNAEVSIRAGKNAMRIKSVSIRFAREETKTKKTPSVSRRGESSVALSLSLLDWNGF